MVKQEEVILRFIIYRLCPALAKAGFLCGDTIHNSSKYFLFWEKYLIL